MKGTASRGFFIVFLPILTVRSYFLVRYIFVKLIKIGPPISHIFRITNHRSLFFWKHRFIFKSLFDGHRSIDYRFAHHCKSLVKNDEKFGRNWLKSHIKGTISSYTVRGSRKCFILLLFISKLLKDVLHLYKKIWRWSTFANQFFFI